jgi:hypothetical protein
MASGLAWLGLREAAILWRPSRRTVSAVAWSSHSGVRDARRHVLVRWRERGVFMVVSLLGHDELHQQLATIVAERVRVVSPGMGGFPEHTS